MNKKQMLAQINRLKKKAGSFRELGEILDRMAQEQGLTLLNGKPMRCQGNMVQQWKSNGIAKHWQPVVDQLDKEWKR